MQAMAAAYSGPHRLVLNRNPTNLGLTAHVSRVMQLATGAFVVQNAGDDVSHPERAAKLVAAWQAGAGRVMAVHSGMRRLGADGATAPYPPSRPPMAGVTPYAGDPRRAAPDRRLARLGPRGLRRLRAAAGAGPGRGPPDRLPRQPARRDRLDRRAASRLPRRRRIRTPAGPRAQRRALRLPAQGAALGALVHAGLSRRHGAASRRPTPPPAGRWRARRSPGSTSRSASPRPATPAGRCSLPRALGLSLQEPPSRRCSGPPSSTCSTAPTCAGAACAAATPDGAAILSIRQFPDQAPLISMAVPDARRAAGQPSGLRRARSRRRA